MLCSHGKISGSACADGKSFMVRSLSKQVAEHHDLDDPI